MTSHPDMNRMESSLYKYTIGNLLQYHSISIQVYKMLMVGSSYNYDVSKPLQKIYYYYNDEVKIA